MHSKSISLTLTCAIVALTTLLIVVAASAVTGLVSADRHLAAVDRTWLSGIERLGDLKIRIAQIAAASDAAGLRDAQAGAARDAEALDEIVAREGGEVPGERADGFARFERDWSAFRQEQGNGINGPATRIGGQVAGQDATAVARRAAPQERLDALAADARQAAGSEIAAADAWAKLGTGTVAALTTLAVLLTIGLLGFVEMHVTTPLATITGALTRLAGGHRDTQVPELHRTDEIGAMATAFEIFRANAVSLAEAQERAEALARHDALTGLPNRRLFASALETVRDACIADGAVAAVMLIDLDRFKPVNDLHGHAAGDAVLCEIAARLRTLAGAATMVARLGGDEFAIILPGEVDRRQCVDAAIQLASRVVATASEPIALPHASIVLGCSIGISLCPSDGNTAEEVLRTADLAMYRAKHDGRGGSRFFEASMDEELRAKVGLEADIRLALARDEIEPHYQPLVELASDRIVGFEILARWPRPGQGLVPPDTFIPIIEQLGLLDVLTTSLLTRALRDARGWPPYVRLAVNISPAQFQDAHLPTRLAALLLAESFLPQRLEVEVTETALIGNLAAARATLDALRSLGVRVVLDDFGTGYSSLSHLREFRFDKIKIDRSFIRSLHDDADSRTIVDAVLGLARNLGLPAVAEGIEHADIRDRLADGGCSFGQGYWFSKAVPAEVATAMLADLTQTSHATPNG